MLHSSTQNTTRVLALAPSLRSPCCRLNLGVQPLHDSRKGIVHGRVPPKGSGTEGAGAAGNLALLLRLFQVGRQLLAALVAERGAVQEAEAAGSVQPGLRSGLRVQGTRGRAALLRMSPL